YAGSILFLASLAFAKTSLCASFLALSPDERHRKVTYSLGGLIILWAISSIFTAVFQCGPKLPWNTDHSKCINEKAFLEYSGATNALTDLLLVCLPVWIIYPLQMPIKTRLTVISFFISRILVIVATIFQMIYTRRLFTHNWTHASVTYLLCTQILQLLSISTVCVAYFWPFMKSLRSGLM
ncbi:uncharacterized protein BDR25DRAFT_170427, partial [Lindgomyces ingoldianus]